MANSQAILFKQQMDRLRDFTRLQPSSAGICYGKTLTEGSLHQVKGIAFEMLFRLISSRAFKCLNSSLIQVAIAQSKVNIDDSAQFIGLI